MKLPRDLSGARLIKALGTIGYEPTRQTGSHVRVTSVLHGEHHVTIPLHDPLRIGTLAAILADVAAHCGLSREQLVAKLFDRH
ncbi:MAG: type II toxin-antitoxin system HicA family toxin [Burkholderiaceae bacterium]